MSLAVAPATSPAPAPSATVPTAAPGATSSPSTIYVSPANPAALDSSSNNDSSANDATPALRALPVDSSGGGLDASTHRKFYTLSASLRETYDDNVNTTSTNKQSSLETDLSPSILVDFPTADGDFTGRYTFGLTYYGSAPSSNGNGSSGNSNYNIRSDGSIEMSHDLVAQFSHSFSSRFQMNLAEEFRYYIEPSILQSVGSNYQSGPYISNVLNGTFTAQWTPLFSTTATFANTVVRYDDSTVGEAQNSVEDTGSFAGSYAVLPKISASAGIIIDDISYESGDRGYTSYTLFAGGYWQALPSLSVIARGGGSYTETVGNSQSEVSPYAALSVNWTLGARSALNFNYQHEVTPSSQSNANGELSDRFSTTFSYQITPRLSSHLDGIFTSSTISDALGSADNSGNNYQEEVYQFDAGLAYSYNSNFSFDAGVIFTGVDSNNDNNNYTRDEAYVGVRGTY